MNLRLRLLLPVLVLGACKVSAAELTRNECTELYLAVSSLESGLSPANVTAAADAINALRPTVEALDKGKLALQKAIRALNLPEGSKLPASILAQAEALEEKGQEVVKVDLPALKLTPEELKDAKVKPALLAVLKRHFSAVK